MCDVLYGITQTVGEVIGGVNTPFVTCHGVFTILNPAHHNRTSSVNFAVSLPEHICAIKRCMTKDDDCEVSQ